MTTYPERSSGGDTEQLFIARTRPEKLREAVTRTGIRLTDAFVAPSPESDEIVGHGECVTAYERLAADYAQAEQDWLDTMGVAPDDTDEDAYTVRWWAETAPSGVTQVRRIGVHTRGGRLAAEGRIAATSVRTYALQPTRAAWGDISRTGRADFGGTLEGLTAFQGDAVSIDYWHDRNIFLQSFDAVSQRAIDRISAEARRAVLGIWAGGYRDAVGRDAQYEPGVTVDKSEDRVQTYDEHKASAIFNLDSENPRGVDKRKPIIAMLVGAPSTYGDALTLLDGAFADRATLQEVVSTLISRSRGSWHDVIKDRGLFNRYEWFMNNVEGLQTRINEAVRSAVTTRFAEVFRAEMEAERAKVIALQETAASVRQMRDVTVDCMTAENTWTLPKPPREVMYAAELGGN